MQVDELHLYLKCNSSTVVFHNFAAKNQLHGFFINGTLVWNGLRTKEVLTCYKSTICFCTPLCYILSWVGIAWLKFINHYLGSAGLVVSTFAFHRYCSSSNPKISTLQILSIYSYAVGAQAVNSLLSADGSLKYLKVNDRAPSRNKILPNFHR